MRYLTLLLMLLPGLALAQLPDPSLNFRWTHDLKQTSGEAIDPADIEIRVYKVSSEELICSGNHNSGCEVQVPWNTCDDYAAVAYQPSTGMSSVPSQSATGCTPSKPVTPPSAPVIIDVLLMGA